MITFGDKQICEYCLEENCSEPCRFCGFDKADFKKEVGVLMPGSVLSGRYLVGKTIGKGGFGITYLAYDTKLEKKVALKEYYPSSLAARDEDGCTVVVTGAQDEGIYKNGMEKFYEEARLVSTFNGNPSIVSVYEFFYENDTAYFVMELLRGVSLKTYIAEHGCLSSEQTLYIADKVSSALMAAHSTNTLHRDISPDNIMLCEDGKVKLIDFGAARQVAMDNPKSMSVILKQGFAPLEQYQRRGKQGPWTDLYSLGATLYYAQTKICLDDPMSRLEDDSEFQANSEGIEPQLWEIIRRSLNIKIDERYKDSFEFRAALNKITYKPQEIKVASALAAEPAEEAQASLPAEEAEALPPTKLAEPAQAAEPGTEPVPVTVAAAAESIAPTKYARTSQPVEQAEALQPAEEAQPAKEQEQTTQPIQDALPPAEEEQASLPAEEAQPTEQAPKKAKKPKNKKLLLITRIAGAVLLVVAAVILVFTLNYKKPFDIEIGGKIFPSNAKTVDLSNMGLFNRDIENITQFTNLKYVILDDNNLTDISLLAELKTLEGIQANNNYIANISFLADMKRIKYIYMNNNIIRDISVFSDLKSIKELWLVQNRITDISPIAGNKNMVELGLSDNNIKDISAVKDMKKLKVLFIYNCGVTDISALAGHKALEKLDIRQNHIEDLSPLDGIDLDKLYNGE